MGDNTVRKVEKGADKLMKKASKQGNTRFGSKVENLGKLELEVSYSHETLEVYLGNAKGLPVRDKNSSDPYAKVYLLHSNPSALFVKGHEQTKTHKKNLNPNFNETFTFKGIDRHSLLGYKLVVAIWDHDLLGDDYMCGIRVSMSHFNYDSKGNLSVRFWVNLQTHYTDGHPIEIGPATMTQFMNQQTSSHQKSESVSSSSSSSPSVRETKPVPERNSASVHLRVSFDPKGFLKVFLIRAQGLPDKDLIGKSDPYAKIYMLDGHSTKYVDHTNKLKTKTVKNNQNPDFHEGFEFKMNLQLIRTMRCIIEIWDDDFGKDDFLAGVMFNMSSFNLSAEVELTLSLYSGRNQGLPFEIDDVMRFATKKTSRDSHFQQSTIIKERKSVVGKMSGTVTFRVSYDSRGFLHIFLMRAQNLPDKDMIGKSDPYAKVYLMDGHSNKIVDHSKKLKTKTHKNNQNPDIHEGFEFKINAGLVQTMKCVIEFWDDDFGKDDFLAGVMFFMSSFHHADMVEMTLSLYGDRTNGLPYEVDDVMRFVTKTTRDSHFQQSTIIKERKSVVGKMSGTVSFRVSFDSRGFLHIFLMRAQNLPDKDAIGKSDPYAKVYLMDGHSNKIVDHNKKLKTKTHKNNQNPDIHESFEFKINTGLIQTMRCVIEFWDDDFGKDDYLAGVMFFMSSFHHADMVEMTLSLYGDRTNGLPYEVDDVMRFVTKKTSSVVHTSTVTKQRSRSSSSSSSSSSDDEHDARTQLKRNNDKLVQYIENARILAQAKSICQGIPDAVTVEENVRSSKTQDLEFNTNFENYLIPATKIAKEKLMRAREELERLREKNQQMSLHYNSRAKLLSDKDRDIWALENELINMKGKCSMIEYEIVKLRELDENFNGEKEFYMQQLANTKSLMGTIKVDHFKREIEERKSHLQEASIMTETEEELEKRVSKVNLPIKIHSLFKERMLDEISAKRKAALRSIGELHLESRKIMTMYENIVQAREKGSLDVHMRKSRVEKTDFFRGEIMKLKAELERLEADYDRQHRDHESQLRMKRDEFERFRLKFEKDLQAWFAKYGAEFNAWCREQIELVIYDKLLEFEEKRLASGITHSPKPANISIKTMRTSYSSQPHTHLEHRSHSGHSSTTLRGSTYSTTSATERYRTNEHSYYSSKSRKESGYFSPDTKTPQVKSPEGTLGRASEYSDVFNNIRSDVEA